MTSYCQRHTNTFDCGRRMRRPYGIRMFPKLVSKVGVEHGVCIDLSFNRTQQQQGQR